MTLSTGQRNALAKAGLAMVAFPLITSMPYGLLVQRFNYDDVLRRPPEEVLAAFDRGGAPLIAIWLAFALCALAFILVAAWTGEAVRQAGVRWPAWADATGIASALAQAAGLLRWVFVIPMLAGMSRSEHATPLTRNMAVALYGVLNQYAGVAIGEHLGQTLLAAWTAALSSALLRGLAPRWLGWVGLAIATLWIVGQSKLLATVIPSTPTVTATPIAFVAWEAWMLVVGVVWVRRALAEKALELRQTQAVARWSSTRTPTRRAVADVESDRRDALGLRSV